MKEQTTYEKYEELDVQRMAKSAELSGVEAEFRSLTENIKHAEMRKFTKARVQTNLLSRLVELERNGATLKGEIRDIKLAQSSLFMQRLAESVCLY